MFKIFNLKKWNRDQASKKYTNKLEIKEVYMEANKSVITEWKNPKAFAILILASTS